MQNSLYERTTVVLPKGLREEAHRLGINVSAACRDGLTREVERKAMEQARRGVEALEFLQAKKEQLKKVI